jgi:hypothetical protein
MKNSAAGFTCSMYAGRSRSHRTPLFASRLQTG